MIEQSSLILFYLNIFLIKRFLSSIASINKQIQRKNNHIKYPLWWIRIPLNHVSDDLQQVEWIIIIWCRRWDKHIDILNKNISRTNTYFVLNISLQANILYFALAPFWSKPQVFAISLSFCLSGWVWWGINKSSKIACNLHRAIRLSIPPLCNR